MSWKRFFIGEAMPDKNAPENRERYDGYVSAGRRFAEKSGMVWLAGIIYRWAFRHRTAFLVIVFVTVIFLCIFNLLRLFGAASPSVSSHVSAVSRVDSALVQHKIVSDVNTAGHGY